MGHLNIRRESFLLNQASDLVLILSMADNTTDQVKETKVGEKTNGVDKETPNGAVYK